MLWLISVYHCVLPTSQIARSTLIEHASILLTLVSEVDFQEPYAFGLGNAYTKLLLVTIRHSVAKVNAFCLFRSRVSDKVYRNVLLLASLANRLSAAS